MLGLERQVGFYYMQSRRKLVRWHNSAQQHDKRHPGGGKAHSLGRRVAFYPEENWRGVQFFQLHTWKNIFREEFCISRHNGLLATDYGHPECSLKVGVGEIRLGPISLPLALLPSKLGHGKKGHNCVH